LRIALADFAEKLEAIAVGKTYVEEQQIERVLFELSETRLARFRAGDAIALGLEQELEAFADF
jgi:hypothetical protein